MDMLHLVYKIDSEIQIQVFKPIFFSYLIGKLFPGPGNYKVSDKLTESGVYF